MLRVQRSQTTTIVITVTELTTIANPGYLFEFIEEQSDERLYAILADTSLSTQRFNEFTIVDGVDVTFPIDGFYTYKVYEQEDGSGNLDPTGLNLVEVGRMHVYVNDAGANEYTDDITNNIYE